MLCPFRFVGVAVLHEIAVICAQQVVVSGDKKLLRLSPICKHPPPRLGMKLHLAHLAAMREVTAMDDGIHALRLEVFERGGKVFVRPVRPDAVALVRSPKMRVAHDAKNKIRRTAVFPARWSRKEPPTAKPERRRSAKEISPCHGHRHSLISS